MADLSRREATLLSTLALASLLVPKGQANAYGTIPVGADVSIGRRDTTQQLRAAFGNDVTRSQAWRGNDALLHENMSRVSEYFNSDTVPNEYARHYANHWREESWWESGHIFDCVCCFLVLRQLSLNTSFQAVFEQSFIGRERFTWHYEVTWSSRTYHYVVDEWSRLRRLNASGSAVTQGFYGWVYYEHGRYVALDHDGGNARRVRGLRSNNPPDFIYPA